MKTLLLITYYWFPNVNTGTKRWLKFARELVNGYRYKLIVVTPPLRNIDKDFSQSYPPITLINIPIKEFNSKKRNKLLFWLRGNFLIPDAKKFWIKPCLQFLNNDWLRANKVETIISTGPPHTCHLIAMEIKKRFECKWVADFRDSWTNSDYYDDLRLMGFADQKHKRLEKQVLQAADEVICVSPSMAKEYEGISGRKIRVITNGY